MKSRFQIDELRRQLGDPYVSIEKVWARPLLWVCLLAFISFVGWASWATVNEISRGEGRVIPDSKQQSIQSLEGGIIENILVEEGQVVKAGQAIVLLNQTRFRSAYLESKSKAENLQAAIARLQAEVFYEKKINFPESLTDNLPAMDTEAKLFKARRLHLVAAEAAIRDELKAAQQQLAIVGPLVARKVVGEMEALKLKRDIAALRGRLTELKNAFVQDAYTELVANKAELAAIEPVIVQREDQLARTQLTSPVWGVVNNIAITTRGGIVAPGEEIMQITPLEDRLLFETKLSPSDVAFVAPGMPAIVKISAYDYSRYGGLVGYVERISSDTLKEQTPKGEETYYKVLIRTDRNWLKHDDDILPIKPGMIAIVDIQTGKRSVLSYLLKPINQLELH